MKDLVDDMFITAFNNPELAEKHDSARVAVPGGRLAFTTDSYVVNSLVVTSAALRSPAP
jgi:hydrogenase expression/formation protein HypE